MSTFDLAQFRSVARELPRPIFEQMVLSFARETDSFLQRMSAGIGAGDLVMVARAAHDMRGFAANFGAVAVNETTRRIEAACQVEDAFAASDLVRQVREDCAIAWSDIGNALSSDPVVGGQPHTAS